MILNIDRDMFEPHVLTPDAHGAFAKDLPVAVTEMAMPPLKAATLRYPIICRRMAALLRRFDLIHVNSSRAMIYLAPVIPSLAEESLAASVTGLPPGAISFVSTNSY